MSIFKDMLPSSKSQLLENVMRLCLIERMNEKTVEEYLRYKKEKKDGRQEEDL